MWLARLTEMGLLRPGFVPPKAIRDLRDYTRARTRLVHERTRCWQRLEKLLEGALVKVSVASKLTTVSAQDMIKALIAGERDPRKLAALARGKMKAKHDDLVEALDGLFDDHHGEQARPAPIASGSASAKADQLGGLPGRCGNVPARSLPRPLCFLQLERRPVPRQHVPPGPLGSRGGLSGFQIHRRPLRISALATTHRALPSLDVCGRSTRSDQKRLEPRAWHLAATMIRKPRDLGRSGSSDPRSQRVIGRDLADLTLKAILVARVHFGLTRASA
jgi:hypothetical protein